MKHNLILLILAVTFVSQGAIAQEQAKTPESTISVSEMSPAESDKGFNVGINVDIGDELTADEKIDEVVELVGKVHGEIADELKLELEGLSAEEKAQLVSKFEHGFEPNNFSMEDVVVPVVAIISVFGLPVFILIVLMASGYRKRKQKMELVSLYLEKGQELPEHVINAFGGAEATSSLRSGLTLVGVGIGLVAAFGDSNGGNFGLIPLFIGVARLIYWYMEERTPKQQ